MQSTWKNIFFVASAVVIYGCGTVYQSRSVQYVNYKINKEVSKDSSLQWLVKPYADSVHSRMNKIIAMAAITLNKGQPESTLGNVIADALYAEGMQQFSRVDAAIMNNGGIRLNSLAAGEITLGKVFELAPFDNTLVLMTVPGKVLQALCDHISTMGGWPVSQISWQIKDLPAGEKEKKAINIFIKGKLLDINQDYFILTNDYVANGGDYCEMLRPLLKLTNGFLLRDALINYFSSKAKEGKKITASIENRITYADKEKIHQ